MFSEFPTIVFTFQQVETQFDESADVERHFEDVEQEGQVLQDGQVRRASAGERVDHLQTGGRCLGGYDMPVEVGQSEEALHGQFEIELESRRMLAR